MDGTVDHHAKQSKLDSERQRSHVFSYMWKIDSNDKLIQNYKHVCNVRICEGTWEKSRRKREC
jgi:hypothetical protein